MREKWEERQFAKAVLWHSCLGELIVCCNWWFRGAVQYMDCKAKEQRCLFVAYPEMLWWDHNIQGPVLPLYCQVQFYHAGVLQPILKFLSPGWLFPDSWHLFGWTGTLTIYTATGTASFYAYLYKEVLKLAMCNLQSAAGDPAHWTQHVGALALLSAQLSVGCQRRWTGYTLGHSFLHSWSQVSRVMSLKTTAVLLRHSADLNKVLLCTRIQIHAHTCMLNDGWIITIDW